MATFLYSDPHYGHFQIIKYCNRPFTSAEEMDAELIKRYNSRVTKNDTVIWLGDCGFYKDKEEAKALLDRLNGKKILIRGNHDKKPGWMAEIGFDFVCESATILIGKNRVSLSHYPYQIKLWKRLLFRLKGIKFHHHKKRLNDDGSWLIHGHTHSLEKLKEKMINVGVEAWDYRPVPMKEIVKLMNQDKNKA